MKKSKQIKRIMKRLDELDYVLAGLVMDNQPVPMENRASYDPETGELIDNYFSDGNTKELMVPDCDGMQTFFTKFGPKLDPSLEIEMRRPTEDPSILDDGLCHQRFNYHQILAIYRFLGSIIGELEE